MILCALTWISFSVLPASKIRPTPGLVRLKLEGSIVKWDLEKNHIGTRMNLRNWNSSLCRYKYYLLFGNALFDMTGITVYIQFSRKAEKYFLYPHQPLESYSTTIVLICLGPSMKFTFGLLTDTLLVRGNAPQRARDESRWFVWTVEERSARDVEQQRILILRDYVLPLMLKDTRNIPWHFADWIDRDGSTR